MPTAAELESLVHHQIVRGLIDAGRAPTGDELATKLGVPVAEIEATLRRLDAAHGLVLHPHVVAPWVVHPFATSPTLTWVAKEGRGWWAPCIWCGLGVATLVGGDVTIHSRIGGESEDIEIQVHDGDVEDGLWAHFPEPPRLAWGNVHHFCARLLPFRSASDVAPWAARHGFKPGEVLPMRQLARLARVWYGTHANVHWKKWTMSEAAEIFRRVGLEGPFWSLESKSGVY
jgi:hypothetical protein